jgi:hypothetical protein
MSRATSRQLRPLATGDTRFPNHATAGVTQFAQLRSFGTITHAVMLQVGDGVFIALQSLAYPTAARRSGSDDP